MAIINLNRKFYFQILTILAFFLLDRISKLYVIYLDKSNLNSEIYLSKFINIHLYWNEGIAFGLFSFLNEFYYNVITILILLVISIILFMIIKSSGIKKISLMLILSGALGNVFDRIYYKAVPDFIDLHIGNFHWFIFNIADIFITFGVLSMIFLEIFDKNKKI